MPEDCPPSSPAGRHWPSVIFFAAVALGTLTGDLVIKSLAFEHVAAAPIVLTRDNSADPTTIPNHVEVVLIPKLLALKLTVNTGAVFGLGKGRQWFFAIVSVVAVFVLLRVFYSSRVGAVWLQAACALILAGAIGNLYDRFTFHAVRDMFWLFPGVKLPFGWTWPGDADSLYPWLFNLADAALLLGVTLLVLVMWRHERHQQAEPATPD